MMKKKFLAVFLCFTMICSLWNPVFAIEDNIAEQEQLEQALQSGSSVFVPNNQESFLFSSIGEDVVSVAKSQVGVSGRPNTYTYWLGSISGYGSGGYAYPWCHAFVSWCGYQAGMSGLVPRTASCSVGANWFQVRGLWQNRSSGYIPKSGDYIYFDWSDTDGAYNHVGIVNYVSGNVVYTIEGNSSDAVREKSYSLDYSCIQGYGIPQYDVGVAPTNVSLTTDSDIYDVTDTIQFNVSSDNAASYYMEIYCNDVQVWTGSPTGGFSYTPPRAGEYTANLVATNSTGSSSSGWIYFKVGVGSRSVSGDFNGDGLDDYATLYDLSNGKMQIQTFLSTGSAFSEEIWWEQEHYYVANTSGKVAAGDFNGDGLDDIAVMYEYDTFHTAIHVFTSTGNSFNAWQTWYEDKTGYAANSVTGRVTAGDFNGDGIDDIAAMYEYDTFSTAIHVFTSTGKSFNNWQAWYNDETGYSANRDTGKFTAGDFNGDGLDDIAAMFEYDTFHTAIHVFTSTGNSFNNWQTWYEDKTGYESNKVIGRFAAGDFNGDGLYDVAAMYEYDAHSPSIHVFISKKTEFNNWSGWLNDSAFALKSVTGRFTTGDFNGDGADDIATMYDYDEDYAIFHMYISDKTKLVHKWWNKIGNYNVRRTTGFKGYTDDYTQKFTFNHEHTYKETVKAAECTEQGYTIHSCTAGDSTYYDTYTDAIGHSWGVWQTIKEATYSETGLEKRICELCGEAETNILETVSTPVPTATPTPTSTPTATPTSTLEPEYAYTITDLATESRKVKVSLTNNFGEGGKLIVASYDKDGRLISVSFEDFYSVTELECTLKTDGAAYIAAFVWKDFVGIKPISNKKVIGL